MSVRLGRSWRAGTRGARCATSRCSCAPTWRWRPPLFQAPKLQSLQLPCAADEVLVGSSDKRSSFPSVQTAKY